MKFPVDYMIEKRGMRYYPMKKKQRFFRFLERWENCTKCLPGVTVTLYCSTFEQAKQYLDRQVEFDTNHGPQRIIPLAYTYKSQKDV